VEHLQDFIRIADQSNVYDLNKELNSNSTTKAVVTTRIRPCYDHSATYDEKLTCSFLQQSSNLSCNRCITGLIIVV